MKSNKTASSKMFVYEDQEHHSSLLDNLNMLRKNRQFCDVILQVGTSQDIHEIYAHKVVLSSSSPFFLEMFTNDLLNLNLSLSSNGLQQYRMVNVNGNRNTTLEFDPEAFDYIIEYAYTARLEIPAEKIRQVYAIASRLKMTTVAYKCGQFLLSTLTPENCLEVRNMKTVLKDPFLLQSVDGYIRTNFEQIVQNNSFSDLIHVKIEFLFNSEQEEQSVNDRHMFNEILDWIKKSFENETLDLTMCKEKLLMLYYNKTLNEIHDCTDIEPESPEESELIEDYKKLSKRLSNSGGSLTKDSLGDVFNINGNGVSNGLHKVKPSMPSKPRQFLFARSDSESSLSSITDEDDAQDWKLLANCRIGKQNLVGLVTITGNLCFLTIKTRTSAYSNNKDASDNGDYCLIPPMSSPRCAVGTAELDGKLFVCGGYDRGECLKTVEVYDTVDNKWQSLEQMKTPRGRFSVTVVNGSVYAIGGCDGHKDLDTAECYNSLTLNWNSIPNSPVVRSNAGVCSMDSKIYVIGGWSGNRGLTRCDMYDPDVGKWLKIAKLRFGRYQTSVCTLDNVIYAIGGCDSWTCLNSVEAYVNGDWKQVASLQTARRGCGVATYKGKIYAIGGHDGIHALCSVEIYDPVADEWTFGKPLTIARANVGAAIVGNRLYAVGGFNGKAFLNTIEYYDFDTNEWTTSVPIDKRNGVINGAVGNGGGGEDYKSTSPTSPPINNNNNNNELFTKKDSKVRNSLSSEPLVEVEETAVGH